MSKVADNFYKSDKATQQAVTFKNQYQMNVTGSLFMPKGMDQRAKTRRLSSVIRWGSERAELDSLCAEARRTRLCDPHRSLFLG